jgi:ATP-binding cassette, subfamily B, multidrug efflux pump
MLERLKPLAPYLRRYWKSLAWGGVSTILYNVIKVLLPAVIGHAIDDMQHSLTQAKILHHALILLLIAASSAVFLYITRQVVIGASREIEFDLRNDIFANLERQSASYYHTHRTGDIMARTTNDLNAVRQLLGPAIMYSANTIVFTFAALPFMYRISPKLTFFAFVPLPMASVLVQYFGARIHRRFERIQAMFSDISAKAQENFSGARLIRAFAQEDAEIASFEEANREYIKRSLHLVRLMAMLWPTLEFVLGLSLMITLLVGGHEVVSHRISVGQFTAFNVYMVQLTWPMIAVGWVVNLFQRGTASIVRIDELLKQGPDIADDPTAVPTPVNGDIEFRNLNFAYPGGPPVLENINLRIPAGSSLAIVGPTGSGKSTLVGLIPRLHDAPAGEVLIDQQPVRHFTLAELRKSIGYIPQETFLFSDTIRQNIAFGKPDASPEQVQNAASIAHISTEILEFPKGFDTLVGERGVTLSAHSDPRRRPRQRRYLHRRADTQRSSPEYGQSHHGLHLAPHFHRPQRRPDRRLGQRPHRRARHSR